MALPTCSNGVDTTALSVFLLHEARAKSERHNEMMFNFFMMMELITIV
jgi:hypothetical protein